MSTVVTVKFFPQPDKADEMNDWFRSRGLIVPVLFFNINLNSFSVNFRLNGSIPRFFMMVFTSLVIQTFPNLRGSTRHIFCSFSKLNSTVVYFGVSIPISILPVIRK